MSYLYLPVYHERTVESNAIQVVIIIIIISSSIFITNKYSAKIILMGMEHPTNVASFYFNRVNKHKIYKYIK